MNIYNIVRVLTLSLLMHVAYATPTVQVFVSFSMPEQLLQATLAESARLSIPAFLNGLVDNSMPATVKKIQVLSKTVLNLNLQIDPTAFEQFDIQQVPALVVDNNGVFDVLYGNLSLSDGLLRIAGHGASGLTVMDARRIIGG